MVLAQAHHWAQFSEFLNVMENHNVHWFWILYIHLALIRIRLKQRKLWDEMIQRLRIGPHSANIIQS